MTIPPLLRERFFRRYWLGQSISMVGDQISLFAVPITAVLLLHAHASQMGLLTAAGLLPSLLFSLPAGAFADRSGRRRLIMLTSDVARALLMASIPLAYALGGLAMAQLYLVAFVVGVFDVLFTVCAATMFISVVRDPEHYVEGQSLLNGSRAASDVAGQSSAGLLTAALSAAGAILLDAASFLVSAFFLARIRPEEPPAADACEAQVSAGLRFIRRSAVMRTALGATTCVNLFTFIFQAIFILYATTRLHVRPGTLGLVLGAGGMGAVLGSLITNRVCRRIGVGWTFALGMVAFPAPLVLVPLAGGAHEAVLAMLFAAEFGAGLGVMLLDIAIGAIFAPEIPATLRSRVSGAYRMINYGIRPLGAVLGGVLGTWIGLRPTLWIAVGGACLSALFLIGSPILRLKAPARTVPDAAGASVQAGVGSS